MAVVLARQRGKTTATGTRLSVGGSIISTVDGSAANIRAWLYAYAPRHIGYCENTRYVTMNALAAGRTKARGAARQHATHAATLKTRRWRQHVPARRGSAKNHLSHLYNDASLERHALTATHIRCALACI